MTINRSALLELYCIYGTYYVYTMEPVIYNNMPAYHICIYDNINNIINDMYYSNCNARIAWYAFYHMARRNEWYENGR